MKGEARKHILQLAKEKFVEGANTTSLSRVIRLQSNELFHYSYNFIYELLQNADDAKATEISFQLQQNILLISHNGEQFNKEDVERICDISTTSNEINAKSNRLDKTGYKGIGFKSVFALSNDITILSNEYCFSFNEEEIKSKLKEGDKTEYPWQIIPIYKNFNEVKEKLNSNFILSEEKVNFFNCIK